MRSSGRRTSAAGVGSEQSVHALVEEIAARLANHSEVVDGKREARELLAALLDQQKSWPLIHGERWTSPDVWTRACAAADKRAAGVSEITSMGGATRLGLL